MARLNQSVSKSNTAKFLRHPDRTVNEEGGYAFNIKDPELALYARVMTCMLNEPRFYSNDKDTGYSPPNKNSLVDLIHKVDPLFVLQLAAYARSEMNLRSVPMVLLGEASLTPNSWIPWYIDKIIRRADELAEVVAYVISRIGDIGDHQKKGSLPHRLKKGLAHVFHKFNEYELSKYNNENKAVKLRDVLKLVHPKPNNQEEANLWGRLLNNELKPADTWENLISNQGSNTETWTKAARIMPIMATLRNLRNLLDHEVPLEVIKKYVVENKLTDPRTIKNSRQFPFRFYTAYRELENHTGSSITRLKPILRALETAMDISIENLPQIEGTTAIFADHSGSMDQAVSEKSVIRLKEIADVMMAIGNKLAPDNVTGVFADDFKPIMLNDRDGILNNVRKAANENVGGATFAYKTLDYLIENKIKVDRIILLSDMQCYNENTDPNYGGISLTATYHGPFTYYSRALGRRVSYHPNSIYRHNIGLAEAEEEEQKGYVNKTIPYLIQRYRREINPQAYFYSVDLAHYGTVQVPENDPKSCLIAGWSEKIFNYISLFEQDGKSIVQRIKEKYNPAIMDEKLAAKEEKRAIARRMKKAKPIKKVTKKKTIERSKRRKNKNVGKNRRSK